MTSNQSTNFHELFATKHIEHISAGERFDRKFALDVMTALGIFPATQIAKEAGDAFGCEWVNMQHYSLTAFGAEKIKKPVTVSMLFKGDFSNTPVFTKYRHLVDDWEDKDNYALAFDHHGDGIAPLVLTSLEIDAGTKMTLNVEYEGKANCLYIARLVDFLKALNPHGK